MALGFFKKLFGEGIRPCLGVDIGTTSIKIAEIIPDKTGARLGNYGMLETLGYLTRGNTALQASGLKIFEQEVGQYLKIVKDRMHTNTVRAVASLPSFSVFSTVIDLPPIPEKEVVQAVQFKARQYIPLPITSVSLDFTRISPQRVLVFAIPNDIIAKYKLIFKAAGLELVALEAEGVSLARAFGVPTDTNDAPTLVIDIGARSTALSVISRGMAYLTSQTDFSGATLTHAIAAGLHVVEARAEELKRRRGVVNVGFGAEEELSTLLLPLVDAILNEAKRLSERYVSAYGVQVKNALIAGGGANLPGITEYAAKGLNMQVQKAMPFGRVQFPPQAEIALTPLGPSLAVAVGAGLRGIS
jgi:type IV pilus assembly protein PilM